jgi:hypothetical protein
VKNLTSTGLVDGFFGDKWGTAAAPDENSTTGGWKICNHECGSVTEAQGKAWNSGKARVLETTTSICGDGPYFANGDTFVAPKDPAGPYNVSSNLGTPTAAACAAPKIYREVGGAIILYP